MKEAGGLQLGESVIVNNVAVENEKFSDFCSKLPTAGLSPGAQWQCPAPGISALDWWAANSDYTSIFKVKSAQPPGSSFLFYLPFPYPSRLRAPAAWRD
jgi:hypothetical protein